MKKRLFAGLLAAVMAVSMMATAAFAVEPKAANIQRDSFVTADGEDLIVITRDENGEIQVQQNNEIEPRIPGLANILYVGAHDDGNDNWSIWTENIGIDWIDLVTFNVRVYNEWGLQHSLDYWEEDLKQFIPRRVDKGYTRGWTRIEISRIKGYDEGDYGTLPDVNYYR